MSLDKNALAASAERIALVALIAERDGSEFDGEIHLTSEEGERIVATLAALPTTSVSEPVAWTSQSNIDGLRNHDSFVIGSIVNKPNDSMCIPVFLAAQAPSEPVSDLVKRLRAFGKKWGAAEGRQDGELSLVNEAADALAAAEARAAEVQEERDTARQIVRDIHWMAVRYADGRKSYAPGMLNDALRKAYDAGWLKYVRPVTMQELDPRYAREGAKTDLGDLLEAAEARIAELEHRSPAEGAEVPIWDVEEFKIWSGIDPAKAVWHGRGYACSTWNDAAELMEFLSHNDPSLLLRVAPSALPQPPEAK